jgi:hypothetical protein
MKVSTTTGPMLGNTMLVGLVCVAQVRSSEVLWLDIDMKNIPKPKERASGHYDYFFKGQLIEGAKQELDVPRWIQRTGGIQRRHRM